MGKRVLVCGGRDFDDMPLMTKVLDAVHQSVGIDCLIEGGEVKLDKAKRKLVGTDYYADEWTFIRNVMREKYKAIWYPKGEGGPLDPEAGFKRNQRMLDDGKPDMVIAFPGGRVTADMVKRALAAGIAVFEVDIENQKLRKRAA